jgi:methylmalonyl-CoA/ethylmalonyl-CoA epimerase
MSFGLNRIGQIALSTPDVDRAETFYRDTLGLRHLYRFGDLTFFDCGGVRLLIEKSEHLQSPTQASAIYFSYTDITLGVSELERRGVAFKSRPHLVAPMEDHDLWMAFFEDPDGNTLAPMHEAPKGYIPTIT